MASVKAKGGWKGRSGTAYGKHEEIVPKDFIRIQPLPYEDSQKAEVVARTSTILMDQRPTRDDFSHSNQTRRRQQMARQGLKSLPTAPYGELGSVEMDTKALIARTLGQLHNLDKESSSECSDEEDSLSGYSSSSSVGLKVPAEASDLARLKLDRQLKSAQKRLDDVALGRCLFTMVRSDEQDRLRQRQEAALEESKRLRDNWNPGRDANGANAPGSTLRVSSTSARAGVRSVSAVSRGYTTRGGADGTGTGMSATSVEVRRGNAPRAQGSGRYLKKKRLEKINIDGGTSVPRLSQFGSRQTLAEQSDSSSGSSWSEGDSEEQRDSGKSGPPSGSAVDGSSSTQLGAFSRSTVDGGVGSDEDDAADLKSMHKYLSAMRWILDGMLADNPAALPPVMESWLPGTHHNSLKAHQERFQKRKATDEEWEDVLHRPVTQKLPHTALGLRVPRRPRVGGADSGRLRSPQQSQVGPGPPELALRGDVHTLTLADCDVRAQTRPSSTAPLLRIKSGSWAHKKLGKEDMEWFVDHISQHGQRQRKAHARGAGPSLDTKSSAADTSDPSSVSYKAAPVDYDPQRIKKRFDNSRARRNLIVQTQLMAMEKERYKTCQQKFEALLKLGPNGRIWDDLRHMRAGVQTESAEMARRKLMMNYQWYDDLILSIPAEALSDRLCSRVLARLKKLFPIFVELGPDRLDKKKLFGVLCQLQVWERELPEVEDAINFVRNHVIFIPDREFRAWRARGLQEHHRQQTAARRKGTPNPALDDLIKKKMRAATEIMTAARMI